VQRVQQVLVRLRVGVADLGPFAVLVHRGAVHATLASGPEQGAAAGLGAGAAALDRAQERRQPAPESLGEVVAIVAHGRMVGAMERNVNRLSGLVLLALLAGCQMAPEPAAGPEPVAMATGDRLTGRARVVDGDTLEVSGVAVRLKGLAAPERRQAGGAEATAFMRELTDGRTVVCDLTNERTWGRRVGTCRVGGKDVAAELVAAGLARDCERYGGGRYAALETRAGRRLPLPELLPTAAVAGDRYRASLRAADVALPQPSGGVG
jgi:endonuclease YncB( thermonuclease family)